MSEREVSFVQGLHELSKQEDRGTLAALRRGLGKRPGEEPAMFPFLVPRLQGISDRKQERYYLVASLFASHPTDQKGLPLAQALAKAKRNSGSESMEQRLMALLNSPMTDLSHPLRQAVSLAKAHNVPLDYEALLMDLRNWDHPHRFVQRRWAEQFWGNATPDQNTGQQPATAEGGTP